uniref:Uncharacterized protein n=1 Tax=Lactuca sativa TaxID=4236 RepID=A0A9R1V7V0_LACSA|nr:hypothetical protein LSAT_V11C600304370 [Lactuca sativa]
MWCLTQTEVHLHLPFALALYLSGIALGTTSSSRICRGDRVTRLSLSYGVDTSRMVPISIRDLGTKDLGKMWVLTREAGQPWRAPGDDIVESIRQVEPKVIPDPTFVRRHIPRHADPDHPEPTLGDVLQGLTAAQEERRWMMASLVAPRITGYDCFGPSGTHFGDTDDDDDDKETKTESEGSEQ